MILIDADVLLVDIRYPADVKFPVNREALERIRGDRLAAGITAQALLEVIGVLSFNIAPARVPRLPHQLCLQYQLAVIPDFASHPDYAGCTVSDLITQMSQRMALDDAVQAVQIAAHAPAADCLLTWNARHFASKVPIPVMTPEEWLKQQSTSTP